ncbi:hypothetical protein FOA52_006730, partial [Chlamydomonas sp. UWO 241]
QVSKCKVQVEQKPWVRTTVGGVPHDHAYVMSGTETRTVFVNYNKAGELNVTAGVKDLQVLKTTQAGYVGFHKDEYTLLPEATDRILATSVTSTWKYSSQPACYDVAFAATRAALTETFFGPPKQGVYSPSVQYTMYQMGEAMLDRVPQIESVFFNCPNIHFLPCNPVTSKFNNDVYVATSEPHGNIECVVSRKGARPHVSKL